MARRRPQGAPLGPYRLERSRRGIAGRRFLALGRNRARCPGPTPPSQPRLDGPPGRGPDRARARDRPSRPCRSSSSCAFRRAPQPGRPNRPPFAPGLRGARVYPCRSSGGAVPLLRSQTKSARTIGYGLRPRFIERRRSGQRGAGVACVPMVAARGRPPAGAAHDTTCGPLLRSTWLRRLSTVTVFPRPPLPGPASKSISFGLTHTEEDSRRLYKKGTFFIQESLSTGS